MVRPNSVKLFHGQPGEAALRARVAKAAYIGKHMEYTIETPVGELFVVDEVRADGWKMGEDVFVSLQKDRVKLLQH